MPKLHNPLFSLSASGSISGAITFLKRLTHQIVEKKPELKDAQTTAQLSWRHMFLKVVALWHALSAAEKAEWESAARPRHMTGYAWFVSQALRPNPGIYLPLQGGTMQGIIDMDGFAIQDLLDPVGVQDADTKAARDAAIAAAIGGSLTCDIYGYSAPTWYRLLVESAAQHNLRVAIYQGANLAPVPLLTAVHDYTTQRGLQTRAVLIVYDGTHTRQVGSMPNADATAQFGYRLATGASLWLYNGATWDRARSWPTGTQKVGRAPIGLSDMRRVAVGQVKAAAGQLYWMLLNPAAGNSIVELTDALAGGAAIKIDHFDTARDGHMLTFDPPLEFLTGIFLETFTNMTSITFGYK